MYFIKDFHEEQICVFENNKSKRIKQPQAWKLNVSDQAPVTSVLSQNKTFTTDQPLISFFLSSKEQSFVLKIKPCNQETKPRTFACDLIAASFLDSDISVEDSLEILVTIDETYQVFGRTYLALDVYNILTAEHKVHIVNVYFNIRSKNGDHSPV